MATVQDCCRVNNVPEQPSETMLKFGLSLLMSTSQMYCTDGAVPLMPLTT